MAASENIHWIKHWLSVDVFPRWCADGVDGLNGSFFESLSRELKPVGGARRAMVQGRQIYSINEGARMGLIGKAKALKIVSDAAQFLIEKYVQSDGSFVHSVNALGAPENAQADLYAQSFALFGLANAYQMEPRAEYKNVALTLLKYLQTKRKHTRGGFTETVNGKTLYQQNPHMHLFEATLAWGRVDSSPEWEALAIEILTLMRECLVDRATGHLAEEFTPAWEPARVNGHFGFEPGHQYEWSWLLAQAFDVFGLDAKELSRSLFESSERRGLNPKTGMVYDEIWSNGEVKKSSSRFWPQAERIKAALVCRDGQAADKGLSSLKRFLPQTPTGVWEDTWSGTGFSDGAYKASSLYHIISALSEYVRLRESI